MCQEGRFAEMSSTYTHLHFPVLLTLVINNINRFQLSRLRQSAPSAFVDEASHERRVVNEWEQDYTRISHDSTKTGKIFKRWAWQQVKNSGKWLY